MDIFRRRRENISNVDIPFVHEGLVGKEYVWFICALSEENSISAFKYLDIPGLIPCVVQGGIGRIRGDESPYEPDEWLAGLVKKHLVDNQGLIVSARQGVAEQLRVYLSNKFKNDRESFTEKNIIETQFNGILFEDDKEKIKEFFKNDGATTRNRT